MIQPNHLSAAESELNRELISKYFTSEEKKVIELLQKQEVFIINETCFLVTNGYKTEKINLPVFYNLAKKGLIVRQVKWPFTYILSDEGKLIKFSNVIK